jgi:hypothetical protein
VSACSSMVGRCQVKREKPHAQVFFLDETDKWVAINKS